MNDRVRRFLDDNDVHYVVIYRALTPPARPNSAAFLDPVNSLSKTLAVRLDGRLALVVLPASERLSLPGLAEATGAAEAVLADDADFLLQFPDCDTATMPPFGNLYGVDVLIAHPPTNGGGFTFPAGTHHQVVSMAYPDFERLVRPRLLPDAVLAA